MTERGFTSDPIPTKQQLLEILKNYQVFRIHPNVLLEPDFDIDYNEIRLRIEKMILADPISTEEVTEYVTYEVPATTWQMFKSQHQGSWWLDWLVRRRPVVNNRETVVLTFDVKKYHTYPEAKEDLVSRLGRPFPVTMMERHR